LRVRDRCMGWVRGWLGEEVRGVGFDRKSSYMVLVVSYVMSGGWLVVMVWKSEDWVVEVV